MIFALLCTTLGLGGPPGLGELQRSSNLLAYTTQRFNNRRDGWNPSETILTQKSVGPLSFGKRWTVEFQGQPYAQPLYVPQVTLPEKGVHNIVLIATQHNMVYAFDADAPGEPLWSLNLGNPVPNAVIQEPCGCNNIEGPEYGITSTPVIDTRTNTAYVVAKHFNADLQEQHFNLYGIKLETGEVRPNYPIKVQGSVPGDGGGSHGSGQVPFQAFMQNQRPGLALSTATTKTMLYVAFGSICDDYIQEYHGWVFAYDVGEPTQPPLIWCTTPEISETGALWKLCPWPEPVQAAAGIWMSGSAPAIDSEGNIYISTGNGLINADLPGATTEFGRNVGNSYVKLPPELNWSAKSGAAFNFHTPSNERELDEADADVGSAGVVLVDHPNSTTERLVIASAKDGRIRVMDRDNLGGFTGRAYSRDPNLPRPDDDIVQKIEDFHGTAYSTMSYWLSPSGPIMFHSGNMTKIYQFNVVLEEGKSRLRRSTSGGNPITSTFRSALSTSTVISSDGSKSGSGVLWILTRHNATDMPKALVACSAEDVSKVLYTSNMKSKDNLPGKVVKFSTPTVVNGKVYVGTASTDGTIGYLTCYGSNLKTAPGIKK